MFRRLILLEFNLFCLFFHCTCGTFLSCDIEMQNVLVHGDTDIYLLVPLCKGNDSEVNSALDTYIDAAVWTVKRLNVLNFTHSVEVGLRIFHVCSEKEYYNAVFDIYRQGQNRPHEAIIFEPVSKSVSALGEILHVAFREIENYWIYLVRASIRILKVLEWKGNVTLISNTDMFIKEFNKLARREWICVKNNILWREDDVALKPNLIDQYVVILGNRQTVHNVLMMLIEKRYKNLLIVPSDGSIIRDVPEDAYVVQEPHQNASENSSLALEVPQTPLLLDISRAILGSVQTFLRGSYCEEPPDAKLCFHQSISNHSDSKYILPSTILKLLKLQDAKHIFRYDVLHMERGNASVERNSSGTNTSDFQRIFSYSIFGDSMTDLSGHLKLNMSNTTLGACSSTLDECLLDCVNFQDTTIQKPKFEPHLFGDIVLRSESWLFGFISISVLGIVFCLAIATFFIVSIFRRVIFEGNPTITLLLLLSTICIYCSVIPFSVAGGKESENLICLLRTFSVSLSYASAFSLLLSRSILLATISKEMGYMSHASGPVQSFLCLFIFAVQCALSLQYFNRCHMVFRGFLFIYSLSYNIILLVLLLCVSPLIYQSQRNYKEGKYFTITSVSTSVAWLGWILGYTLLNDKWKDPMICLGLVTTGSILVGTVFIPRTYLMTMAATRDKLTSALPSLNTSSSVMDIYRASTQPIYDCINITAVNAANSRNKVGNPVDSTYYKSVSPEREDFDAEPCQTPTSAEKVTRF